MAYGKDDPGAVLLSGLNKDKKDIKELTDPFGGMKSTQLNDVPTIKLRDNGDMFKFSRNLMDKGHSDKAFTNSFTKTFGDGFVGNGVSNSNSTYDSDHHFDCSSLGNQPQSQSQQNGRGLE